MPLTKGFTRHNDLPEIQWRNPGETGGGHYEKRNAPPKNRGNHANRERGIMKNEVSSVLLDEKICFIRLSPDTLQNLWRVITDL
jgi:hypothetical protein